MTKLQAVAALWLIGCSFFALYSTNARAMSRETRVKLDAALGNWKAITPELLQDAANSDLLQESRSLAKDPRQTAARVPLIKLGDDEVINSCLEEYRVTGPNRRGSAMTQLGLAGNPKVIPLLASDLNIEESPQRKITGSCRSRWPPHRS